MSSKNTPPGLGPAGAFAGGALTSAALGSVLVVVLLILLAGAGLILGAAICLVVALAALVQLREGRASRRPLTYGVMTGGALAIVFAILQLY